jgi:hypothetical protein
MATATPRSLGDTDAPHMTPVLPSEDLRTVLINRIAWGAVAAGVFLSLVTQLLLNLLGIGIGAATLGPIGSGENPDATSFSIGAAIWWTVAGIIAAYVGGHTAGRLSGRPKESTAGWHGLTAWAVTTLVVFWLLTTAIGGIIGGTLGALGNVAGGLGQTAAQVAGPALAGQADPFSRIEEQIRANTGNDPQALRDAAVAAVRAALTGDPAQVQEARERSAQALARAQNISVDEARAQVTQYEAQYHQSVDQAKQKAAQAAETARKAASQGAIFGFVALVLGAIAAWFGGRAGAVDPTITDADLAVTERR